MKRCKVCGTSYKDNAEFCLKCNLPLGPSTAKPVTKPTTPKYEEFDPQKLERRIQQDFIRDISKRIVKVSLQHPLPDNTGIKRFFDPQGTKDFKDSMGYSTTFISIPLDDSTLNFQLFILSNVRIIESTRNAALIDSSFYIVVHFFDRSNLEVVRKQLIGIDTFIVEHGRNTAVQYPLAIIGLENAHSGENPVDQEQKDNFQFDLQTIISKIIGLEKRFVIQYFDFSSRNVIDFKELGSFYFERFLKDQKVPTFKDN